MPENLQEQLDQRIENKEQVSALDAADAYAQTIESHRREYIAKGGTPENFEKDEKAFVEKAREIRNKQLDKIGLLNQDLERKKISVVDKTRTAERKERYENAQKYGWDTTDPDKEGNMDDFEGTGDDNKWGFGRTALAGYVSGLQMTDPAMASEAMRKVQEAYKKTSSWGDHYVSNQDIRDIIGNEYLSQLEGHHLTDRAMAFLASYLRQADSFFKNSDENNTYKGYVVDAIDDRLNSTQQPAAQAEHESSTGWGIGGGVIGTALAIPLGPIAPIGGAIIGSQAGGSEVETYASKNARAEAQLNALSTILTPKEWKEAWTQRLKNTLEPFKKLCDTIVAANPEFTFQNQDVKDMLGKNADDLIYSDETKLIAAKEKAREELRDFMQKKKDEYSGQVESNKKSAADLKARYKTLRIPTVSDDEWSALDTSLNQQAQDMDSIAFVSNTSMEDLAAMWGKLVMVRDGNGLLRNQFDALSSRIKDAEEKEPAIAKFTADKDLLETYDPKTKQFSYTANGMRFESAKGKAQATFGNPEINKIFESKISPFFTNIISKYKLSSDEKKHADEIMSKADKNDEKQMAAANKEVMEYVMERFQSRMKADDKEKIDKISALIDQADKDSTFSFDHMPSAEELQKAYDEKFVPAWEKAAKDFDAQYGKATGEQPSGTVGGGFLGGEETPETAPSSLDPYSDHWSKGTDVPLDPDYKGFTGGLEVAPNIEDLKFRDVNTHKILLAVPGGTGATANEITLSEPEGTIHKVDSLSFVKVNYQGKIYYAAMEYLQKNDQSLIAEREAKNGSPKMPGTPANPEVQQGLPKGLEFLGKVNGEYRDALERILRDSEKPGGALFDLYFNKKTLPCRLTKAPKGQYIVNWEGGSFTYRNLNEVMIGINNGFLLQQITYGALLSPKYYEAYEDKIDSFKDDVKATGRPGEVYFELDWSGAGRGEGNAQVWATALPNGLVNYHIHRDHVDINGGNDRNGIAGSFDDFMQQIAHIKEWSEYYEDNRDDRKLSQAVMNREWFYAQLNNPQTFYDAESAIGRPVSFNLISNGVMQMFLDWGGGAARDTGHNAMLNVWADNSGRLNYILNYKGKGPRGVAKDIPELINIVGNQRAAVLQTSPGETPKEQPKNTSGVPVASPNEKAA